jgi:uncharacterized protein YfdQ (DUF2303 family)
VNPGGGDTQAALDAGVALGEPHLLDVDSTYAVVVPRDGVLEIINRAEDRFLDAPRRKSGLIRVYDADSFIAVWTKQSDTTSEAYADPVAFTVTGVLDADAETGEDAGWRDHRVVLESRKTPQWLAWEALDGKMLDQQTFAEHVEDRVIDFVAPTGGEMLELAQSFQATTNVDFESAQALSSSERKLVYKETVTARAGQKGDITIPTTFEVGLTPFEGGAPYRVTARLRFRISNGHLSLGYKLDRPEDVLRTAFGDVRGAVTESIGDRPVLLGHPPAPRA